MSDQTDSKVTYSFTSSGVDAELDGKVIASGADVAEAETAAHEAIKTAQEAEEAMKVASRKSATHVTTPNGLKGTVLGRTPSIWGEEITVRFENGHISKLHTSSAQLTYSTEVEKSAPLERIAALVNTPVSDDTPSLTSRLEDLKGIRSEASKIVSSLKHDDLIDLDSYVASAKAEELEILEVLADRADKGEQEYGSYRPEARTYEESWLDRIAAEEVDTPDEEILEDRVAAFVTALSDDTLADGSLVAQISYDKVSAETDDEDYQDRFVEAAEQVRQTEHLARREAVKQAKIASDQAVGDAPDESIFL